MVEMGEDLMGVNPVLRSTNKEGQSESRWGGQRCRKERHKRGVELPRLHP